MANSIRIKRLIARMNATTGNFGKHQFECWPSIDSFRNWNRGEICERPQSLVSHAMKLIDEEIRIESSKGIVSLMNKMVQIYETVGYKLSLAKKVEFWLEINDVQSYDLISYRSDNYIPERSKKKNEIVLKSF